MDNNENFDQYSLEELRQMLKNLDRQRFADDVLSIEREIAKRTGEPMPEPEPIESQSTEPVFEQHVEKPELVFTIKKDHPKEAERLQRLFAAIIDAVISIVATVPLLLFFGAERFEAAQNEVDVELVVISFIYGVVSLIVIHGFFLHQYAQTIGKRYMNIRIENLDGTKASFSKILYLRFLPIGLIAQIPGIGPIIAIMDSLFIFRGDRRCIHDHIAGTRVMQCPQRSQSNSDHA